MSIDMTQAKTSGAGRPRDPQLEQRVQDAACQLYGEVGWSGFSLEAVAKLSRVGKSSIYLRWPDRASLLLETLQQRIALPFDTDTGSLRGDLLVHARKTLATLIGDSGGAVLRLSTEARMVDTLAPQWEEYMSANVAAMRSITDRGINRGDLPPGTPVTLLLDALFGSLLMRCLVTPPVHMARLAEHSESYTAELVDLLLAAVTGAPTASTARRRRS
jgi:AcrR family transcriptional regulator